MSVWLEKYDEINDYLCESPVEADPETISESDITPECVCDSGVFTTWDSVKGFWTIWECDNCGKVTVTQ